MKQRISTWEALYYLTGAVRAQDVRGPVNVISPSVGICERRRAGKAQERGVWVVSKGEEVIRV